MSKKSVLVTRPSFNLGNVSEEYASKISPYVHQAWKHHNTALIMSDKLRKKCELLPEGSYCKNGVSVKDLLQFVINVPDAKEAQTYTRRSRDLFIESVLREPDNDQLIYARFEIYLSHLKQITPATMDNFIPGTVISQILEVIS